jgi:hypothetical protein
MLIGIGHGIGLDPKILLGSKLNLTQTIDEGLLADNIYLTTEEGYLIVDESNINYIFISED